MTGCGKATEDEARDKLARGIAKNMCPMIRDAKTLDGKSLVTVHNEEAFRAFMQSIFLEVINCERARNQ